MFIMKRKAVDEIGEGEVKDTKRVPGENSRKASRDKMKGNTLGIQPSSGSQTESTHENNTSSRGPATSNDKDGDKDGLIEGDDLRCKICKEPYIWDDLVWVEFYGEYDLEQSFLCGYCEEKLEECINCAKFFSDVYGRGACPRC